MNEEFESEQYEIIYAPTHMRDFESMRIYLEEEEGRAEIVLDEGRRWLCSPPLFEGGWFNMTIGAMELLERYEMDERDLIVRYLNGDFGNLCEEDIQLNLQAINRGEHILARYDLAEGASLYMETDASGSYTTLMDVWER